jgi:predicted dehydrogenase
MRKCFESAYPLYTLYRGLNIVDMCHIDEKDTRDKTHQFGIQHTYRDASSLLKQASPDVVHVLTPPQSHRQLYI